MHQETTIPFLTLAALSKSCFPTVAFAEESTKAAPAVPAATAATAGHPRAAVASAHTASTAIEAQEDTLAATVTPAVTIQDSNETSTEKNALYSVLRVIGSGVTPFNLNRQKTLLNALGQVISTVDFNQIYITDVNPVFASRRRQLLMEAEMQQVNFPWFFHSPLNMLHSFTQRELWLNKAGA